MEDVAFNTYVDWEEWDPKGHFTEDADVAFVQQQIDDDNVWGWCQVKVTAGYEDSAGTVFSESDYLGCCSYQSEHDFKQPGGYYDDMKKVAYDSLIKDMEHYYEKNGPPQE